MKAKPAGVCNPQMPAGFVFTIHEGGPMNATSQPPPAATAEVQLTRAAKEKLLLKMYRLAHWIELIRLFGYKTLPMDKARQAIKPIAEKFGKEPVAEACEAMVEISTPNKEPVARLKPHIRRMAFQILGPEPTADVITAVPPPDPPTSKEPLKRKEPKKSRKPTSPPAPSKSENAGAEIRNGHVSIMDQYRTAKEKHPGMMLLFRMGDFFELFGEDAETAHKLLGLTLTTRDRTLLMAGFPHHQLEVYLHKLLKEGQRVAVCEPVEESLARGPIRREVTRVVTPGNIIEEKPNDEEATPSDARPVRQPRVFVLKKYEAWLKDQGLAFVAVDDVKRTTPAVAQHVGGLDFIVLRGEEKLLVTVRPHLQAKHIQAIHELHELFGDEYKPLRVWPTDGPAGWVWQDNPVDSSCTESAPKAKPQRRPSRSRSKQSK
jgi:MutS-like protein